MIKPKHLYDRVKRKDLLDAVKAVFNAMLNSPKPLQQAHNRVSPSKFGLSWAELSQAIMSFHEPIAQHFYTGMVLTRADNQIRRI